MSDDVNESLHTPVRRKAKAQQFQQFRRALEQELLTTPSSQYPVVIQQRVDAYFQHVRSLIRLYYDRKWERQGIQNDPALWNELEQLARLTSQSVSPRPHPPPEVLFDLLVFAVELAQLLGVDALHAAPVREFITALVNIIQDPSAPLLMRKRFHGILTEFFRSMTPVPGSLSWKGKTLSDAKRRLQLLQDYEIEKIRITPILKRGKYNRHDRLLALRQSYPDIESKKLERVNPKKPAQAAYSIIGARYVISAQHAQKAANMARREVKIRQAMQESSNA
jgi:hypothetical protein